jgi:hypothetical protein
MKRRLITKKVLVATLGVGAVSYVAACGMVESGNPTSGNLMAQDFDSSTQDAHNALDAQDDTFASSGNLMSPPDTGTDAGHDAGHDANTGSDADATHDASTDASDDGG